MKKLSRHLLVQNQQWKHQDNEWNLLKVNNKDTRKICEILVKLTIKSLTLFRCLYFQHWTYFKNCCGTLLWLCTSKCRLIINSAWHLRLKLSNQKQIIVSLMYTLTFPWLQLTLENSNTQFLELFDSSIKLFGPLNITHFFRQKKLSISRISTS